MLQRAASNAYSWWWASHIRTKQSKWLEQCLQDMEEKVQHMLTMIEDEGDSFAKRAEMYYKTRPELITSVEEAYKAFRALADRYDMLSKELQNANHTIATIFPEQVQFAFEDDEDFPMSKFPINMPPMPASALAAPPNVPQVPKFPEKELKRLVSAVAKQFHAKKSLKARSLIVREDEAKLGLSKEEAIEEISRVQKEILTLQTVKEFVKSSYESGVGKYLEMEDRITSMQQRVSSLQDEFDVGGVIEDNEARMLMAEAALKSCQEKLAMLHEKQKKVSQEAKEQCKRIETACQRVQFLRQQILQGETAEENSSSVNEENKKDSLSKHWPELMKEVKEIELLLEKGGGESLGVTFTEDMTVTQMAEKIDELVSKVIALETAVASQSVVVSGLTAETDDLSTQIQVLEEEKEDRANETDKLSTRVRKIEEKLNKIQDLNKNVERQDSSLQTNFAEACMSVDNLSERLSSVNPDEEGVDESDVTPQVDVGSSPSAQDIEDDHKDESTAGENDCTEDVKEVDVVVLASDASKPRHRKTGSLLDWKPKEVPFKVDTPEKADDDGQAWENTEKIEELNWQQVLLSGAEDHEKILIKEYRTLLRNFKDLKKKLHDVKDERDNEFDVTLKNRELKQALTKKDEENRYLREKLKSLLGDYSDVGQDIFANKSDEEIKWIYIDKLPPQSNVEEKIRIEIDSILDVNLEFWFSFSTTIQEVQKFRTQVQDLQDETSKIREKMRQDGANSGHVKSEVKAIYKHLREIQRELQVWQDQSMPMKHELKNRFTSLCNIQEMITGALKEGVKGDEISFESHQAAKFQGEIMNMKHENNRVSEELQAAIDLVTMLQIEVGKLLSQLNHEYGIDDGRYQKNVEHPKVPLRSFLFGKKKKAKASLFFCIHPYKKHFAAKSSDR